MNLKQRGTRIAAAALVAVIALTGAGCSVIENLTGGSSDTRGGFGAQAIDTDAIATALADGLGVDKDEAKAALDEAIGDVGTGRGNGTPPTDGSGGPGERPSDGATPATPPSGAPSGDPSGAPSGRGGGMAQRLAEAVAEALGVDEAAVLEIIEQQLPSGGGQGRG